MTISFEVFAGPGLGIRARFTLGSDAEPAPALPQGIDLGPASGEGPALGGSLAPLVRPPQSLEAITHRRGDLARARAAELRAMRERLEGYSRSAGGPIAPAPRWADASRSPFETPFRCQNDWLLEAFRALAGVAGCDHGRWDRSEPALARPDSAGARSSYTPGPSLDDVLSGQGELARGHSGEGVRAIQSMLNALGARPPLDEDGLLGPKTEAELERFQRSLGDTSGQVILGRDTLRSMMSFAPMGLDGNARRVARGPTEPSPSDRPLPLTDTAPRPRAAVARPSEPPRPRTGEGRDVSEMVQWAKDRVGQPYVFGKNDCGTMVRDYIKHFGLKPGPGSDNHMMLPEPLDFYGAFDASGGELRPMSGRGGLLGKNHNDISEGMVFGIGELCNQSDCRPLGHAPDGSKFDTLFSCSHSGIITKVIREGGRPDGAVKDFEFAEMHGSVKGGGPGMTFHDSFVKWANQPRKKASQFHHAFVYAPPGTVARPGDAPKDEPLIAAEDRRKLIDQVWAREAGGTFEGLVEWDPTEAFPSLGAFHTTWDNPAAGTAGRGGGNSFYDFLKHAQARGAELPPEVLAPDGQIRDRSPWASKAEMDRDPGRVDGLRRWLADPSVQDLQLSFAERRLSNLAGRLGPRSQEAYRQIVDAGAGDLLVDLVNFKGEGAVQGTLQRYAPSDNARRGVAEAAWATLQATRSSQDLAVYGTGWKNRLNGYWR